MKLVKTAGCRLSVDLVKTKKYYKSKPLRECKGGRNFQAQVAGDYPKLCEFLTSIGVDIIKPDELAYDKMPKGKISYFCVTYTAIGEIADTKSCMAMFFDETIARVLIEKGYIEDGEDREPYFHVTVYGVELPFVLDEAPLPDEKPMKRIPTAFERKYGCWKLG